MSEVTRTGRALSRYFVLGTLFFGMLDFIVHAPVRVALQTPAQRGAYYVVLLTLGGLCRWRPRWAPVAGIVESSVNLVLLFVGLWLPILSLADAVVAGGPVRAPLSLWRLLNAALALAVMTYSLRRSEGALIRQAARGAG